MPLCLLSSASSRRAVTPLALASVVGIATALAPGNVRAADEEEVALDASADTEPTNTAAFVRKGLYFGAGVGAGGAFLDGVGTAGTRFHVAFGGALTPRLTLGISANLTPYLRQDGRPLAAGGDLELTGYVHKGLFLRLAPGLMAMREIDPDAKGKYNLAPGGVAAVGHEWRFEKNETALSLFVEYDGRYVFGDQIITHTILLSSRVAWF